MIISVRLLGFHFIIIGRCVDSSLRGNKNGARQETFLLQFDARAVRSAGRARHRLRVLDPPLLETLHVNLSCETSARDHPERMVPTLCTEQKSRMLINVRQAARHSLCSKAGLSAGLFLYYCGMNYRLRDWSRSKFASTGL